MFLFNCLKCQFEYIYEDGDLLICFECLNEWKEGEVIEEVVVIKDVNGNLFVDGDMVMVIKDLKIKGLLLVVKVGIKVKNICLLLDVVDGYDIDCKIDGVGVMKLKFEYVKKV